jgi:arginyl-tRNA synthetase
MAPVDSPRRVVVDYSSPNIAKQMHVGHLRSTIIGDAIARVLMFEGHHVIRQNHVGDWGTQMGQVILGVWHLCAGLSRGSPYDFNDMSREVSQAPDCRPILERIARQQQADVDGDPKGHAFEQWLRRFERGELSVRPDSAALTPAYRFVVAVESAAVPYPDIVVVDRNPDREEAVPLAFISNWTTARMLQQREPAEMLAWEIARRVSILETQATYDRLGVLLSPVDVRGESFYDDRLGPVVAELGDKSGQERGHGRAELREDGGAQCLYLYDESGRPRFKNADGDPLPMIVRKSDGAFLYATTDLAALRFRLRKVEEGGLGAQRIIYVVGAPQRLHFQMLFAAARAAGWAGDDAALEHVSFGSVLGTDNKPLKTRAGDNVKLSDLLDEAEQRARAVFADREDVGGQEDETDVAIHNPDSKIQNDEVARAVGIAAVKYFDLNRDRNKDYVFDWDRMLAMQGNTAPYMMYAYARIRSIYRKAAERFGSPDVYAPGVAIALDDPTERALAMRLARFRETIDIVAGDLSAHVLCNYLYETAAEFMRFYEACPVLQAPESLRLSRMRLCDLTARTLKLGLGLLGIEVIERM